MSSVIDVAWIGVAGVGVGGFISIAATAVNGRIAHRAAETTIAGEHRQRLWEKQSAAYEETVREVLARQTRRQALTSRGDTGNIGSHPREEIFKHEEPESVRIRALLLAYASTPVWAAYEGAEVANTLFWVNLGKLASAQLATQSWAEQQSAGVSDAALPPKADYEGALDAMYRSREDAKSADQALFDAINRELSLTQSIPVSRSFASLWPSRRS
jgi:hypothetical protein